MLFFFCVDLNRKYCSLLSLLVHRSCSMMLMTSNSRELCLHSWTSSCRPLVLFPPSVISKITQDYSFSTHEESKREYKISDQVARKETDFSKEETDCLSRWSRTLRISLKFNNDVLADSKSATLLSAHSSSILPWEENTNECRERERDENRKIDQVGLPLAVLTYA